MSSRTNITARLTGSMGAPLPSTITVSGDRTRYADSNGPIGKDCHAVVTFGRCQVLAQADVRPGADLEFWVVQLHGRVLCIENYSLGVAGGAEATGRRAFRGR